MQFSCNTQTFLFLKIKKSVPLNNSRLKKTKSFSNDLNEKDKNQNHKKNEKQQDIKINDKDLYHLEEYCLIDFD